jgi:hypothetical protein
MSKSVRFFGLGCGGFFLFVLGEIHLFFLSVFSFPFSSFGAHAAMNGWMYRCIGMYC